MKSSLLLALLLLVNPGHAQTVPYQIDAQTSEVYWLVYSAGALSGLGHNHVISAGDFGGSLHLEPEILNSQFELSIPVETLTVDDPQRRAELGEGFSSQPSSRSVEATRRNMLSERVLDAENHPVLRITGTGPLSEPGGQILKLQIELAGQQVDITVPVQVLVDGDSLSASGSFQLSHEQLGMEPYSAMFGTLKVAQEIDFFYRVSAYRQ